MKQTENICSVSKMTLYDHEGVTYVSRLDIANSPDVLSHTEAQNVISRLIPVRTNGGKYYYRYLEFLEQLSVIEKERREAMPKGKHRDRRYRGYSLVRRVGSQFVPYSQAWGEFKNAQ